MPCHSVASLFIGWCLGSPRGDVFCLRHNLRTDACRYNDCIRWLKPFPTNLTKYGFCVLSLRPMKFTLSHTFSRTLLILVCCSGASAFGSAASVDMPDSPSWVQLSPASSPPARSYLAVTYDAASGKVILFGGFGGNGYLN